METTETSSDCKDNNNKSSGCATKTSTTTTDFSGHQPIQCLPAWTYRPPHPTDKPEFDPLAMPDIDSIDLGQYVRQNVTNLEEDKGRSRDYFDVGLRLMLSYQHELAARCFMKCLETSQYCALAHALVALCHAPNYNFKGEAYYESAHHPDEETMHDLFCVFPSQQVADRHSKRAIERLEEIRKLNGISNKPTGGGGKKGKSRNKKSRNRSNNNSNNNSQNGSNNNHDKSLQQQEQQQTNGPSPLSSSTTTETIPKLISDVETQLVLAIRILTSHPGLEHTLADDIVGKYQNKNYDIVFYLFSY
jgi:hypothetical protein